MSMKNAPLATALPLLRPPRPSTEGSSSGGGYNHNNLQDDSDATESDPNNTEDDEEGPLHTSNGNARLSTSSSTTATTTYHDVSIGLHGQQQQPESRDCHLSVTLRALLGAIRDLDSMKIAERELFMSLPALR